MLEVFVPSFLLCMESNALENSINKIFARIP